MDRLSQATVATCSKSWRNYESRTTQSSLCYRGNWLTLSLLKLIVTFQLCQFYISFVLCHWSCGHRMVSFCHSVKCYLAIDQLSPLIATCTSNDKLFWCERQAMDASTMQIKTKAGTSSVWIRGHIRNIRRLAANAMDELANAARIEQLLKAERQKNDLLQKMINELKVSRPISTCNIFELVC